MLFVAVAALSATAQTYKAEPFSLALNDKVVVSAPAEGLWSVATDWRDDWMCDWHHASPERVEQCGQWSIVHGKIALEQGDLVLRDSYRQAENGLVQCIRRFEWHGSQPLE